MAKKSAGILLYRINNNLLEILLVHPGGPFWAKKDLGSWSIPKGEFADDEIPLEAAKREFKEETGIDVSGEFIELTPIRQHSGKIVHGFAIKGDIDPKSIKSNTFEMEWPPKSGQKQAFLEIDRGEWFNLGNGKIKINKFQAALLDELAKKLNMEDQLSINESSDHSPQLGLF